MNALATIADQSNIADGIRGWAFVAAIVVIGIAVATILTLVAAPHNVPVMGDELSRLDRADGIGQQCRRSGHYYRLTADRTVYVCANTGCDDVRLRNGGAA